MKHAQGPPSYFTGPQCQTACIVFPANLTAYIVTPTTGNRTQVAQSVGINERHTEGQDSLLHVKSERCIFDCSVVDFNKDDGSCDATVLNGSIKLELQDHLSEMCGSCLRHDASIDKQVPVTTQRNECRCVKEENFNSCQNALLTVSNDCVLGPGCSSDCCREHLQITGSSGKVAVAGISTKIAIDTNTSRATDMSSDIITGACRPEMAPKTSDEGTPCVCTNTITTNFINVSNNTSASGAVNVSTDDTSDACSEMATDRYVGNNTHNHTCCEIVTNTRVLEATNSSFQAIADPLTENIRATNFFGDTHTYSELITENTTTFSKLITEMFSEVVYNPCADLVVDACELDPRHIINPDKKHTEKGKYKHAVNPASEECGSKRTMTERFNKHRESLVGNTLHYKGEDVPQCHSEIRELVINREQCGNPVGVVHPFRQSKLSSSAIAREKAKCINNGWPSVTNGKAENNGKLKIVTGSPTCNQRQHRALANQVCGKQQERDGENEQNEPVDNVECLEEGWVLENGSNHNPQTLNGRLENDVMQKAYVVSYGVEEMSSTPNVDNFGQGARKETNTECNSLNNLVDFCNNYNLTENVKESEPTSPNFLFLEWHITDTFGHVPIHQEIGRHSVIPPTIHHVDREDCAFQNTNGGKPFHNVRGNVNNSSCPIETPNASRKRKLPEIQIDKVWSLSDGTSDSSVKESATGKLVTNSEVQMQVVSVGSSLVDKCTDKSVTPLHFTKSGQTHSDLDVEPVSCNVVTNQDVTETGSQLSPKRHCRDRHCKRANQEYLNVLNNPATVNGKDKLPSPPMSQAEVSKLNTNAVTSFMSPGSFAESHKEPSPIDPLECPICTLKCCTFKELVTHFEESCQCLKKVTETSWFILNQNQLRDTPANDLETHQQQGAECLEGRKETEGSVLNQREPRDTTSKHFVSYQKKCNEFLERAEGKGWSIPSQKQPCDSSAEELNTSVQQNSDGLGESKEVTRTIPYQKQSQDKLKGTIPQQTSGNDWRKNTSEVSIDSVQSCIRVPPGQKRSREPSDKRVAVQKQRVLHQKQTSVSDECEMIIVSPCCSEEKLQTQDTPTNNDEKRVTASDSFMSSNLGELESDPLTRKFLSEQIGSINIDGTTADQELESLKASEENNVSTKERATVLSDETPDNVEKSDSIPRDSFCTKKMLHIDETDYGQEDEPMSPTCLVCGIVFEIEGQLKVHLVDHMQGRIKHEDSSKQKQPSARKREDVLSVSDSDSSESEDDISSYAYESDCDSESDVDVSKNDSYLQLTEGTGGNNVVSSSHDYSSKSEDDDLTFITGNDFKAARELSVSQLPKQTIRNSVVNSNKTEGSKSGDDNPTYKSKNDSENADNMRNKPVDSQPPVILSNDGQPQGSVCGCSAKRVKLNSEYDELVENVEENNMKIGDKEQHETYQSDTCDKKVNVMQQDNAQLMEANVPNAGTCHYKNSQQTDALQVLSQIKRIQTRNYCVDVEEETSTHFPSVINTLNISSFPVVNVDESRTFPSSCSIVGEVKRCSFSVGRKELGQPSSLSVDADDSRESFFPSAAVEESRKLLSPRGGSDKSRTSNSAFVNSDELKKMYSLSVGVDESRPHSPCVDVVQIRQSCSPRINDDEYKRSRSVNVEDDKFKKSQSPFVDVVESRQSDSPGIKDDESGKSHCVNLGDDESKKSQSPGVDVVESRQSDSPRIKEDDSGKSLCVNLGDDESKTPHSPCVDVVESRQLDSPGIKYDESGKSHCVNLGDDESKKPHSPCVDVVESRKSHSLCCNETRKSRSPNVNADDLRKSRSPSVETDDTKRSSTPCDLRVSHSPPCDDIDNLTLSRPISTNDDVINCHPFNSSLLTTACVFVCIKCNQMFSDCNCLVKHRRVLPVYSSLNTQTKPSYSDDVCEYSRRDVLNPQVETQEKQISCERCNESFARLACLRVHQMTHRTITCRHCGEAVLTNAMSKHVCDYSFTCKYCYMTFGSLHKLKQHRRTHMVYECYDCGETFVTHQDLVMHQG